MIDRIPPQALDIERAILGTCLVDRSAAEIVCEKCAENDFYTGAHRKIFKAIATLFAESKEIDIIVLSEQLRKSGDLEAVGEEGYLAELSENLTTASRIEQYIDILRNKAQLRQLIIAASELQTESFQDDAEAKSIISITEQKFLNMTFDRRDSVFYRPADILPAVFEDIDRRARGVISGIPTGFVTLDQSTGGLERGDLIILAGRPSMGKTAFALQIADNCGALQKTVAFFSIEMNKEQLVQRMLSMRAEINLLQMRNGQLPKRDYPRLSLAAGPVSVLPVHIDDIGEISAAQVLSKARRLKIKENALDLIIIDHLQLMDSGDAKAHDSRNQELSQITRGLKKAAKFLDVPIILLSQLSRACEIRSDHRPQLSDLRDSGAIEQDADIVLFLYRPEVYDPDEENANKAEIIIGKQRNGPIGKIDLLFKKFCAKFADKEAEATQEEMWQDKV